MNLIAVQLETCHANSDGSAWYAYFRTEPTEAELSDGRAFTEAAKKDGGPLGLELSEAEEVPNDLSKAAGFRRYYVASAV